MIANHRMINDESQAPLGCQKSGDAGAGEICFGLTLLGFALAGYLSRICEINDLLHMALLLAVVMIPVCLFCDWSSRIIQRRFLQPGVRPAALYIPASTRATIGHQDSALVKKARQGLTVLMALICVVAFCLALFLSVTNSEFAIESVMVSILTISVFAAYVGTYWYWIVFNGQQKHAWKWAVMALMALGLLMVGQPVHGDYLAVWLETALFIGVAFLGSGVATLYFYARPQNVNIEGSE